MTVQGSVRSRAGRGGTAPERVAEQITELREAIAGLRSFGEAETR